MKQLKKHISLLLCIVMFITALGINGSFFNTFATTPTHTGTVNVDDALNVRNGAGTGYKILGQLKDGDVVTIYATEGSWYKIAYQSGYGYVHKDYIINLKETPKYDYNADFEENLTKQNFPESYKVLLRQLHAQHPDWIFLADHLSMTWEEAVTAESEVGKSLVQNGVSSIPDSWKSMAKYAYDWDKKQYVSYDSGNWVTAEREVVEYYMEPRNFLNESSIYMFLDQSYNPNIQNTEGLQKILNGTFMEGDFPEDTHKTYNEVLMEAAKKSGVSPYVLAASILIEQGNKGTGGSIKGTIKGYEGIYNFFNIRAYAENGYDAVTYGLIYAKGGIDGKNTTYGRPWNTRAKSILGGAEYYGSSYVKRGQDNLYYKKFNVIVPDFYAHQYMTNVQAAYSETSKLKSAYSGINAALTFSIPVYKSMPAQNKTALPTSKGANNYYLTKLTVDGKTPEGFDMYKNGYEMIVGKDTASITVAATPVSGASVSGTGKISLKAGKNTVNVTVTAASGKKAVYTLFVFRQEGGAAPDPEDPTPTPSPAPTFEGKYKISTYISGLEVGVNVDNFIKGLGVKNGSVKVFSSGNKQKTTGTVVTGDKAVVYDKNGAEKYKYDIVIFGDINGDGKISISDTVRFKKHMLEIIKLTSIQHIAADVNRDGKVSILDSVRFKKYFLEISKIEQ